MPQHPNDLLRHDCVNFRYQSTGQEAAWLFDVGGKLVEFSPASALIIDVSDAIAATLAAGAGIGISTTYIAAPFVRRRELVPVLHEFAYDRFHLNAVWPERRRSNPAVKAFVDFLQDIFPSPAPWDVWCGIMRPSACVLLRARPSSHRIFARNRAAESSQSRSR